jgi:hypothetical protein
VHVRQLLIDRPELLRWLLHRTALVDSGPVSQSGSATSTGWPDPTERSRQSLGRARAWGSR